VGTVTALFVLIISKGLLIQRKRPVTGKSGMIGAVGNAHGNISPSGKVAVKGEYWDAISIEGPIHAGDQVVVERVEGRKLLVRRK